MTKEEILQAAKNLHYTEKLALAQSLIQISRKDIEEITSQFQPKPAINDTSSIPSDNIETTKQEQTEKTKEATTELSFEDIVARLRKLNCRKEKTMLNSIAAMHQFRGGISESDSKKIILKMCMKKIISISETGAISWN